MLTNRKFIHCQHFRWRTRKFHRKNIESIAFPPYAEPNSLAVETHTHTHAAPTTSCLMAKFYIKSITFHWHATKLNKPFCQSFLRWTTFGSRIRLAPQHQLYLSILTRLQFVRLPLWYIFSCSSFCFIIKIPSHGNNLHSFKLCHTQLWRANTICVTQTHTSNIKHDNE